MQTKKQSTGKRFGSTFAKAAEDKKKNGVPAPPSAMPWQVEAQEGKDRKSFFPPPKVLIFIGNSPPPKKLIPGKAWGSSIFFPCKCGMTIPVTIAHQKAIVQFSILNTHILFAIASARSTKKERTFTFMISSLKKNSKKPSKKLAFFKKRTIFSNTTN